MTLVDEPMSTGASDSSLRLPLDLATDPPPDDPEVVRVRALLESRMGLAEVALASCIGRYMVLDRIGAGAMGVVYRGFDPELERPVALKLLHAELDSPTLRERLLREARAMAKVSSAHVATVFEAGVHAGRSFVAMELVHGRTLRQWQKEARRSWPELLAVYRQAALGLAEAHDAALVHRDFKPDNAMIDAQGRVKVLDFGLARGHELQRSAARTHDDLRAQTDDTELEATPLTRTGALIGTPAYMAPELLAGGIADARSDQFAFCVALFEALHDERPFKGRNAEQLLASMRAGATTAGAKVPAWIGRAVGRGLALDPAARWPSLRALAAALDRDPGRARRRGLALGIVGVTALAAWSWQRIDRMRTIAACDAAAAELDATWDDGARARVRAAFAASDLPFATDSAERVIPLVDAQVEAWRSASATACVHTELEHVWTEARLAAATWCLQGRRSELAAFVEDLAQPDTATITGAVMRAAMLEPIDPCTDGGRLDRLPIPPPEQVDAVQHIREQLATLDVAAAAPDTRMRLDELVDAARAVDWPPLLARALAMRAALLSAEGDYAAAHAVGSEAYFAAARVDAWDVASDAAISLVALLGDRLPRPDAAMQWSQHAELAIAQLGDASGLRTARLLDAVGRARFREGELELAYESMQRAAELREHALGPDHAGLATSLNSLAIVTGARGDGPTALALTERAVALLERTLGPEHPNIATALFNLGNARKMLGDTAGAEAAFARSLAISEAAYGPAHPEVGQTLSNLGLLHYQSGDSARARPLLERALAIREAALGATHPDLVSTIDTLASVLAEQGEPARAVAMMRRGLAITEAARGPDHPEVAHTLRNLGTMAFNAGDLAEGRALYGRALAIFERALGPEHAEVAETFVSLAVELAVRRADDTVPTFARAIAIYDAGPEALPGEAAARFAYAKELVALEHDRELGCAQATIAREQLRGTSTDDDALLAELDGWLGSTRCR